MKIGRKVALLITALVIGLMDSCASTGGGFTLEKRGEVLGVVETTFVLHNTLNPTNDTDAINAQAYTELLEVAQREYSSRGLVIDIRYIVVSEGRHIDAEFTEYYAHGTVIQAHQ